MFDLCMMPVQAALVLDSSAFCLVFVEHMKDIGSGLSPVQHDSSTVFYELDSLLSTVLVMDNMSEHHCLTKVLTSSPSSQALEGFRAVTVQSHLTADCQPSEADVTVTARCSCAAAGAAPC